MEQEKHIAGDSSPESKEIGNDHVEAVAHQRSYDDPSYVDHRADDDRADEAKGRNADKFDKKYWLSVNYIGTLFAIGMAFMGGIGGKFIIVYIDACVDRHVRLWFDCTSSQRNQCGHRSIA